MEQLISPKEAADRIGVSLTTVKAWMRRSTDPLPSIAVGASGTHRRIVASLISPWLDAEAARETGLTK